MFLKNIKFYALLFIMLCTNSPINGASNKPVNLVFDLGGVVIDTKKFKAMQHIGFFNVLFYGANPRKAYFQYLDSLVARLPSTPTACDENGNILPQLMCNWMLGTQSGKEISKLIKTSLQKNTTLSSNSINIINDMTTLIFDDVQLFLSTKKIVKETVTFIQECKNQGFGVYILSNWDSYSFGLLKNLYPQLFNLFDGIMISGDVHLIKPDPQIFKLLMETYQLDPKSTVFIDDQIENIKAAENLGIYSIICPRKKSLFTSKPDLHYVRHAFYDWLDGAILSPTI